MREPRTCKVIQGSSRVVRRVSFRKRAKELNFTAWTHQLLPSLISFLADGMRGSNLALSSPGS